jgi:hypothetical protein
VPSLSRTVAVPLPSAAYGHKINRGPIILPAQSPSDLLDYTLDLSAWLGDANDQLASASVVPLAVNPLAIAIQTLTIQGSAITAWITAGAPGICYVMEFEIATRNGRVLILECSIDIIDGPPAPPAAMPVWTSAGGMDFRSAENIANYLLIL